MYRLFLCSLLLIGIACTPTRYDPPEDATPPSFAKVDTTVLLQTIALGSCNRQNRAQDYWEVIAATQPDLWIWLGDNIYADTENMDSMARMYARQQAAPPYATFRAEVPVIGTWDDHDYGMGDGDRTYPQREGSKVQLLHFLGVAPDRPVWQRPGVYQSYTFGPEGQRVKILLLDARWFREKLQSGGPNGHRYQPDSTASLLGEAQWAWLEEELRKNEAQVHIIASGVQVLPQEQRYEKWADFPTARRRLLDLLASTDATRPLLLSGDRHLSELSYIEWPGLSAGLYEITSSGLTHSYEEADEENALRLSSLITSRSFALLRIDWASGKANLSVEFKSVSGESLHQHELN